MINEKLKIWLGRIRLFLLNIFKYYGVFNKKKSPLALKATDNGNSHHIREVKRAQILELIQQMPVEELQYLLQEGSEKWEVFKVLRMNNDEIHNALRDHLHFRMQNNAELNLYYRRQVITGIGIIAAGIWLNAILKILPKESSDSGNYIRGQRTMRR
jgi:hypothetical protein